MSSELTDRVRVQMTVAQLPAALRGALDLPGDHFVVVTVQAADHIGKSKLKLIMDRMGEQAADHGLTEVELDDLING
jgi:hypothetical protein